ncbi:MAG: TonB-dependent receptor family protein [Alphaproteobacteria bacterium]
MSISSRFCLFVCTALAGAPAFAQESPSPSKLDQSRRILPLQLTITKGYWDPVKTLPGSGYYVDEKQMEKAASTDIHRIVQQVPGINVQEEDGFGLRPNIGMRGGRIDRSADITLMEDGVLIAPAPYSAPEAYYFPRSERMTGIEVRKGSSAIKFGPRTTNGAVNLLTRAVPDVPASEISFSAGSYAGLRYGGHTGTSALTDVGNFGILAEFHHESSDGFKKADYLGGDTGFNASDYMLKGRYKTSPSRTHYQELEIKLGYTDEDSNETYLGLTSSDFNANPYRRYAASQKDNMDSYHHQVQLSHYIEPMQDMSITTTLYRNDFNRNWYKLNNVRSGTNQSLTSVLNDPNTFAAHLAILQGGNSAANGLTVRANIRDYYGQGIQSAANYRTNLFGVRNDVEFGLRYHVDEQDRYQHDDIYQMLNGTMVLTTAGTPGSQDNRIGSASAWAGFFQNRMAFGNLAVTPGFRYEYVDLKTENFGTSDPSRTGANLQKYASVVSAFVPGIGLEYDIGKSWQALAGVHKGFAPPEPPSNTTTQSSSAEESVNYEAGARFTKSNFKAEAIGFFNDYENLLGSDTFSSGGSGADQFNGGEVNVWGLEASAGYDFSSLTSLKSTHLPVKIGYTHTRAEFQNSFTSTFAEWGNVSKGFELPYIAKHQVNLSAGIETKTWSIGANAKFVDRMRTVAGSGPLLENQSTDGSFVIDLHAEMEAMNGVRPFVSVTNVLDEVYVAARRPAGLRPGAPMMAYAGVKANF